MRTLKEQQSAIRKSYTYGIVLQLTNTVIGDFGYHFEDKQLATAQLGYNLHPDYWGKGLGTELVKHLIKNMLLKHQHINIVAKCDSRNVGSKRVLEKNGFELVDCVMRTLSRKVL